MCVHRSLNSPARLSYFAVRRGRSLYVRNGISSLIYGSMADERQVFIGKIQLVSDGSVVLQAFRKIIFPLIFLGLVGCVPWQALNNN